MPFPQVPPDGDDRHRPESGGGQPASAIDNETRRLLAEVIEALEAVLIAAQVEPGTDARRHSDYAVREAIRRVNRLRRTLRDGNVA